jgi:plastocyanin domain-containing protein
MMNMKNRNATGSAVVAAMVGLFAVSGAAVAQSVHPTADRATDPPVHRMEIEVTGSGYVPAVVELKAGVPAELVFTRTTGSGCVRQVHIPDLGVEKVDLPQNEPVVIAIKAAEPGTYSFMCGMNMVRGTIIVTREGGNAGP